ncbi:MAG: RagB/SusD family nutrient uptake outer membrane protein [Ferruginibacter sp.]|nr:RagB/SusD family nutrient uptake outer membrane protein [Ferruginibacter sp.]
MKKIIIYSFLAVLVISSGCRKLLDQIPGDAQPGEDVLKSSTNVYAILAASYERFTNNDFMGGNFTKVSELYGDQINFVNVTGGNEVQFTQRGFSAFNGIGRSVWNTGYEGIARANVVVKALAENNYTDIKDSAKNTWRGEALFIRGVSHFELTRLYAKPYTSNPTVDYGVVVRQKALSATEAQVAVQRNTVKESYDAAIADLKLAESLLPSFNGGSRATKWAAKAYLARIYFNMADYINAFAYANDVITNSGYVLGADVSAPFKTIGNLPVPTTGVVMMILGNAGTQRGSFWSLDLNNTYLPLGSTIFSAINARGGTRATALTALSTNPVRGISTKWAQLGATDVNVPLIRLSEMYLIRAEARVQNGGFADAAVRADYNAVRAVAGVGADNSTTGATALLTAIRNERAVEFFTEGDSYHELRRLKLNVRGIAFNDAVGLLKIPDGEVRANLGMVQN